MDRRTFLKIAGIGSISIAAGCTAEPEKTLYALVQAPDDMVTGKAVWYASTCRECPAGCGIHIKNREGRAIKIEGNPNHLINRGKICMRGQSALQGVYHPDRIKTPRLKVSNQWHSISFTEAVSLLKEKAELLSRKESDRIYLMSENVGESLLALFKKSLDAWNSGSPLIYEPFAYESIKEANRLTFGINGLASYRIDESDFLLSFGADFLETWLSPVEYARKFKAMHQINSGKKNLFYHIGPYQSLTGANADFWLPCLPGSEAALALGLLHDLLPLAAERHLPSAVHALIRKSLGSITREQALTQSGIKPEPYGRLLDHLKHAKRPLILGTGNSGSSMGNDLPANIAANLLNIVLDPSLALFDFENRHTVERAASGIQVTDFFNTLDTDKEKLLLLNNVNPIYNQSSSRRLKDLFGRKSLYIVSFSNFMDESSELADLIHDYRAGLVPLIVPITLLRHHVRTLGVEYLAGQVFLEPHPKELMLRNHV